MAEGLTTEQFIEKFDHFRRVPSTGNVIIHPDIPYGLIELKAEFVDRLKDDIQKKLMMAHTGIDELDPTTKLVIMLLEKSY